MLGAVFNVLAAVRGSWYLQKTIFYILGVSLNIIFTANAVKEYKHTSALSKTNSSVGLISLHKVQWNKRMVEKQVQISAKIFCPHFQNVHELESKQFLQMLYTVLIGLNGSSCLVHYVKKSCSASLNCMWGPLFPEPFESTFTLLLHLLLCLSINLCFYCSWLDNACLIQNLIIPLDTFYESQLATNVLSNFIKNISHADLRPLNV